MRPRDERLLEIYLDDHWAGAAAGRSLAARLHHNNRNTDWSADLARLVGDIEEDDRTLREIRDRLGFEGGSAKRLLALAGERVARLKFNGRLVAYSPLSRVLECEAMEAGVSAKRRLWAGLREASAAHPMLASYDLDQLISRADDQLELLRSFHQYSAARAFGG